MLTFEGHAIVSADGMIAAGDGSMPAALRNDADWRQYQQALDRAAIVVTGRRGHERNANPGRRRLVLTRSVERTAPDPNDPLATRWNPGGLPLDAVMAQLGIADGTVAITGVFDQFRGRYDRFQISEVSDLLLPGGIPCFADGHPRSVLAAEGLVPSRPDLIDADALVISTLWSRPAGLDSCTPTG